MRNKHLHIENDSRLLILIREQVQRNLNTNRKRFRITIIAKLIVYLGGSLLVYSSLFVLKNTFLFVLAYIALGLFLLLFAFNFAHDFSHNTIFKNKKWNHLGFTAIYTLVGAHAEAWKERHIGSHHFAPNVKEYDSDLQITELIRVSPEIPRRWYHRFQHLYAPIAYTTYSLYWIFIKDFVIFREMVGQKGFFSGFTFSFLLQKLFYVTYILVLPLLFSHVLWGWVLFGFLLMHMVLSVFLLFTFFMTHHVETTVYPTINTEGTIQTSWVMNQILSSNDMHPFSKTANFILGGFNNHIAHHLFPNIHHIYYPELNKIIYRVLRTHDIQPNYTTYWGGICSHLALLKKMGRAS